MAAASDKHHLTQEWLEVVNVNPLVGPYFTLFRTRALLGMCRLACCFCGAFAGHLCGLSGAEPGVRVWFLDFSVAYQRLLAAVKAARVCFWGGWFPAAG